MRSNRFCKEAEFRTGLVGLSRSVGARRAGLLRRRRVALAAIRRRPSLFARREHAAHAPALRTRAAEDHRLIGVEIVDEALALGDIGALAQRHVAGEEHLVFGPVVDAAIPGADLVFGG